VVADVEFETVCVTAYAYTDTYCVYMYAHARTHTHTGWRRVRWLWILNLKRCVFLCTHVHTHHTWWRRFENCVTVYTYTHARTHTGWRRVVADLDFQTVCYCTVYTYIHTRTHSLSLSHTGWRRVGWLRILSLNQCVNKGVCVHSGGSRVRTNFQ
jgi:hypothetical protein